MGCEALYSYEFELQFIISWVNKYFEIRKCDNFQHFSKIQFSTFWTMFFNHMNFSGPEIDIIWYREAYIYVLHQFQKFPFFFDFHHFLSKKSLVKIIFAEVPLSSGEQILIWMKIVRGSHCLRNEYEQIYFFVNISGSNSYQLTKMSANLRNCTFSEISHPGVECFAPHWSSEYRARKKIATLRSAQWKEALAEEMRVWGFYCRCRKRKIIP